MDVVLQLVYQSLSLPCIPILVPRVLLELLAMVGK